MHKKLFGLLFGFLLLCGSVVAFGQCGATIKHTVQQCGAHCGSVVMQTCQGVGSFCEDGTGEFGFGCCGLMLIEPGSCGGAAKATPPAQLQSVQEFLALKDALVSRRQLWPTSFKTANTSCGVDQNAFNDWLEAKLKRRL